MLKIHPKLIEWINSFNGDLSAATSASAAIIAAATVIVVTAATQNYENENNE